MLDLNDFLKVVQSGKVKKDSIMITRRNGEIDDYILPGESIKENDDIEVMNLKDIVSELFELY